MLGIIIIAIILVLVFWLATSKPGNNSKNDDKTLSQLPRQTVKHPPIYLADKNQPAPTNSWFSGLVFQRPSAPAYAYPWVFQTSNNTATLGYPAVTSTPNTIFADNYSDLKLSLNSTKALVTNFDKMSVTLAYQNASQQVATASITHGSPYIFFTLAPHQTAQLTASGQISQTASNQYVIQLANKRYGLWTDASTSVKLNAIGAKLSASGHPASFTLITLAGLNQKLAFKLAGNSLASATTSYKISGDNVSTTFKLATKNHQPTLFGLTPRQYQHSKNFTSTGSLATLLGSQEFASGNSFSYTISSQIPSGKIITKQLTSDETSKLKQLLASDASSLKFTTGNDYFDAKGLYRAANLLELANELGEPKIASQIQSQLAAQLNEWLDPAGCKTRSSKCFYYDPAIRGIVAKPASFGSEQFNDHDFHYGYFIYASAVLARYDHNFLAKNQAMVDLLVDDIASASATSNFPKLRGFDLYTGHSWADGYGLTNDGNNQESSSEAVNAWYASYLWAKVTGNKQLAALAHYLYANETSTALADYTNVDLASAPFKNYAHSIVSLVWGGKLDYSTYFSDTPEAKLGIQLIPMSPGSTYFASDPARISKNLAAIGGNPSQFKDYLLMYQALADPSKASAALAGIKPSDLDGADSMTYLAAWIYSH